MTLVQISALMLNIVTGILLVPCPINAISRNENRTFVHFKEHSDVMYLTGVIGDVTSITLSTCAFRCMEYNCLSFSHSKQTGFCRLHNFKYPPCYPAAPTIKIVSDLPFYREDDGDSVICPCNLNLTDGSWIVMQQRFDGSEDFKRGWVSYREGFGNPPDGEFWLGLEQVHQLTTSTKHVLVVELVDKDGIRGCACFDEFSVGPETDGYRLSASDYHGGTAGNSLGYHSDSRFSTLDRDNDNRRANMISCAREFLGGGNWYNACLVQNLNGAYLQQPNTPGAMVWKTFRNFTGLLKSKMLLKKKTDVYGII